MSKTITTHLTVSAPVEDLWETLTDLAGYRTWNPQQTVRSATHGLADPPGIAT